MPTTQKEIGQYLTPEVARMSENVCGLQFSSSPDTSELSYEDRDEKDESSEPPLFLFHHGHGIEVHKR